MQIAVLSDIHANYRALTALDDVLRGAEKIVCLGDLVGYYCEVNEVFDYLRPLEPICVLGNHDHFLLHGYPDDVPEAVRFGIDYADEVIDADHRRYLASLPWCWGGMLGGRSWLLSHGSPWSPLNDYLYADNPDLSLLDRFDYDVVAFGQTHRVWHRADAHRLLINPGSVGQSRDVPSRACAMLLDTDTMTVEHFSRPYDAADVVQLAMRNGADSWVHKHLDEVQK
jgi:predicted phosphodiesterase